MTAYSRRQVVGAGLGALLSPLSPLTMTETEATAPEPLALNVPDAPLTPGSPAAAISQGTSRRPDGLALTVDGHSLRLGGAPWLPVAGEFHFARYPAAEWRDELLKMKAGGLDVAATYVFWIHHEEEEGRWDWTGRRSLREFVAQCGAAGLHVVVRCGPWCHGEVRNGGFPDWLLRKGFRLRSGDPGYLAAARTLYEQIAAQLRGLLWKDGGPVVGIQVENEFHGPAEHLLTLKRMATEAGLDVPLYTRTGWPALSSPMPFGELLPLYGGYPDGFWDRSLAPMPGEHPDSFLFSLSPADTTAAIGTDQLGARRAREAAETGRYPYLCCEIGGGMETSYHRRVRMAPADIESAALVKIGSGNCLQGYYMYHGGTNPPGRFSTLQESQATGYWNDLPVKSYDFQAPLGEFGQIREHYHRLRRLHLFLRDYGPGLAEMPARLPEARPANARDAATPRWAARTDGRSGFVFVNNYQRLQTMPAKRTVRFRLRLPGGEFAFPDAPVDVPAGARFFWPFRLDLGGATLLYATAQPVCRLTEGGTEYHVFAQTPGVPAEFVFGGEGLTVEHAAGDVGRSGAGVRVGPVRPGTDIAIRLRGAAGERVAIILLDDAASLTCWKGPFLGRERLFLTDANLVLDGDTLRLTGEAAAARTVAVFPPPESLSTDRGKVRAAKDGLFRRFSVESPKVATVKVVAEPLKPGGPARTVPIGPQKVAEAPSDADFDAAAVWRIRLPEGTDLGRDLLLRVRYVGDVARLYLGGDLLTDDFYNGDVFEVGLRRYAPDIYRKELLLKVLPLRKDAPIYLPGEARPDFGSAEGVASLVAAGVTERHETRLTAAGPR